MLKSFLFLGQQLLGLGTILLHVTLPCDSLTASAQSSLVVGVVCPFFQRSFLKLQLSL